MSEIQSVSGGDFDVAPLSFDEVEEKGIVECENEMSYIPGESIEKAKAEEALHRATSKGLTLVEKENALLKKLCCFKDFEELFGLTTDLVTLFVEEYRKKGGDIKELKLSRLDHPYESFSEVVRCQGQEQKLVQTFSDFIGLGKSFTIEEKINGYIGLIYGVAVIVPINARGELIFSLYKFIDFFDRLGLNFNKGELLLGQFNILHAFMLSTDGSIYLYGETKQEIDYGHWKTDVALPWTLKLFKEMEEVGQHIDSVDIDFVIKQFIEDTAIRTVREDYDPLISLLPYIFKYGELEALDDCRECFDRMHADLSPWELELQWILLHLKGVELLYKSDPIKGTLLYKRTDRLIQERLWAYFFSPNRDKWAEAKEQAETELERISKLYKDLK